MTSLKKLLAYNMKKQRRNLGISQGVLAERIDTSTHYIAMIELERKTPSLTMVERIAAALQITPQELFSMRSMTSQSLEKIKKTVLLDIERVISNVIDEHLKTIEENEKYREGDQ